MLNCTPSHTWLYAIEASARCTMITHQANYNVACAFVHKCGYWLLRFVSHILNLSQIAPDICLYQIMQLNHGLQLMINFADRRDVFLGLFLLFKCFFHKIQSQICSWHSRNYGILDSVVCRKIIANANYFNWHQLNLI